MKKFLYRLLFFLQFHRAARFLLKHKVLILTYHGFTEKDTHEGIENHQGKHHWVGRFESQLRYLKKYHSVLSLEEVVEAFRAGRRLPPYSAVITMDDGYRSNYTLAFPLLKKYNLPATIFLTTQFVDRQELFWTDRVEHAVNRTVRTDLCDDESRRAYERNLREGLKQVPQESRQAAVEALEGELGQELSWKNLPEIYHPLNWGEVREMQESGLVHFGSHTHTHVILSRCRPETLERELILSKEIIEMKTGRPAKFFCYPNGNAGDFNTATQGAVKKAGYVCALTTVPGTMDRHSEPFALKRVGAPHYGGLPEFVMYLYGIAYWISDVKQFVVASLRSQ